MRKILFFSAVTMLVAGIAMVSCTCEDEKKNPNALDVTVTSVPQDKNVLVEVFTNNECDLCPNAHRMVNGMMVTYPGKVFCINVHNGAYDVPYITEFGHFLYANAKASGMPSGTVNRYLFPDLVMDTNNPGTAISSDYFGNAANRIMGQSASANISAKAKIDTNTRELVVTVAMCYTVEDSTGPHKLNVALLEDSIWGTQAGGSTLNPTQYDFYLARYCHMHVLRHLITGQWGEEFMPVFGAQVAKTYTYTVPDQISNIDVALNHLKIVAFIARNEQDVINVCQTPVEVE